MLHAVPAVRFLLHVTRLGTMECVQVQAGDLTPLNFVSFRYPAFHLLMPLYGEPPAVKLPARELLPSPAHSLVLGTALCLPASQRARGGRGNPRAWRGKPLDGWTPNR